MVCLKTFLAIEVQNFTFPPLVLFRSSQQAVEPQLSRLKELEVEPIDSNTRTDLNLIEFLFLDMDFNFASTVPRAERLTFKLPDI